MEDHRGTSAGSVAPCFRQILGAKATNGQARRRHSEWRNSVSLPRGSTKGDVPPAPARGAAGRRGNGVTTFDPLLRPRPVSGVHFRPGMSDSCTPGEPTALLAASGR